jgi:hypothetical protein
MDNEVHKDIEQIRAKLDDINKLIAPYKLAYVHTHNECVPLEKNAHYMDKDVLDKLVHNVAEDGFLSQLPFAMKRKADGKFLILSGNHRLKAAIKAGLEYILVLYIDEVSKDRQIAYQLSHNALVGKDDMTMLKEIFEEIKGIESKEYSGLSDIQFIDPSKVVSPSINDGDIELTEMRFLFIESRSHEVERVINELGKQDLDNCGIVYGSFEAFIKVATAIKEKYNIKSNTVAFSKMVSICEAHLADLEQEDEPRNPIGFRKEA